MVDPALNGDFEGTFPFEPRYLDAGDVRLHYVDEGPRDAQPLLFVHGNPTWSYLWRRPLAELPAKGRRCVAFDHMGFGRSDKPPQLARYTLQAHIDNALALIDELDLSDVVLVAHDWGGPIGLGAMLERARPAAWPRRSSNTWAWELPSFLPPFVREFRTEGLGEILALGRQPVRRVDPRRHGPARHRPADDGRLPRAVPRLLVARRHARLPARHPSHRARPQRPPDGHDPRPPARARRAGDARVGDARPGLPARLPRSVARAVPARAGGRARGRGPLRSGGPPGRCDRSSR